MGRDVLFVYTVLHPFVKMDLELLSDRYHVTPYKFDSSKKWNSMVLSFVKQLWFLLIHHKKFDTVYCFFPGYQSFLPMLFGKILGWKKIIVIAGFDGVSIPNIKFGAFFKKNLFQKAIVASYRMADYILAVDPSLLSGMNYYADPTGKGYPIGIQNFVTGLKAEMLFIPFGYEANQWPIIKGITRKRAVVTVGNASDRTIFQRKGFDFLLEIASEMPEVEFHFIGLHGKILEDVKPMASSNVRFLGYVPFMELPKILQEYKVFAQLSLSEGMPNSLSEAMLCGCIPVGSNVNGIPTVIGDCGFLLEKKDIELAKELFIKALNAPMELSESARRRVMENYPLERRKKEIFQVIDQIKLK